MERDSYIKYDNSKDTEWFKSIPTRLQHILHNNFNTEEGYQTKEFYQSQIDLVDFKVRIWRIRGMGKKNFADLYYAIDLIPPWK